MHLQATVRSCADLSDEGNNTFQRSYSAYLSTNDIAKARKTQYLKPGNYQCRQLND